MYGHGLQIGVLDQTAVALAAFYGVLLVIFMIESGIRINFYCVAWRAARFSFLPLSSRSIHLEQQKAYK